MPSILLAACWPLTTLCCVGQWPAWQKHGWMFDPHLLCPPGWALSVLWKCTSLSLWLGGGCGRSCLLPACPSPAPHPRTAFGATSQVPLASLRTFLSSQKFRPHCVSVVLSLTDFVLWTFLWTS